MSDGFASHAGRVANRLLFDEVDWINRRKESADLIDDSYVRRSLSIDYDLPGGCGVREGIHTIPVTLMPKSPPTLMNFDMRDETGRALAMTNRAQNAETSRDALLWAALAALEPHGLASKSDFPPAL